ncbi:MAG TPA: HEAT repeat domain-containing protein [Myxococcaceae bacterium]|nr:HEAT repeat domain-containing protein [Myxococcaceae bacterium]
MLPTLLALSLAAGTPPKPPASLGSPKQEEPAPAARGCPAPPPAPRCPDADTALARALAWVAEPAPEEIRAIAVEDLGLLGDARVLNTLALLILDPSPTVQLASVRAVRAYGLPRAEEILANVVRHPYPGEPVKLLALDSLAYQRTRSAKAFLEHVATGTQFSARLQAAAKATLQRAWSAPAPASAPQKPPAPSPSP